MENNSSQTYVHNEKDKIISTILIIIKFRTFCLKFRLIYEIFKIRIKQNGNGDLKFRFLFLNKYQKKAFVRIFEYKILGKKKKKLSGSY